LELIYGKAEQVTTHTEGITRDGPGVISYDLKAIVFLLDEGQSVSVKPQDYGKGVAIHSGPDPDPKYIVNMAFLLPESNA
jgi:hypothetical protein